MSEGRVRNSLDCARGTSEWCCYYLISFDYCWCTRDGSNRGATGTPVKNYSWRQHRVARAITICCFKSYLATCDQERISYGSRKIWTAEAKTRSKGFGYGGEFLDGARLGNYSCRWFSFCLCCFRCRFWRLICVNWLLLAWSNEFSIFWIGVYGGNNEHCYTHCHYKPNKTIECVSRHMIKIISNYFIKYTLFSIIVVISVQFCEDCVDGRFYYYNDQEWFLCRPSQVSHTPGKFYR